jgi:hypothetical protein
VFIVGAGARRLKSPMPVPICVQPSLIQFIDKGVIEHFAEIREVVSDCAEVIPDMRFAVLVRVMAFDVTVEGGFALHPGGFVFLFLRLLLRFRLWGRDA